MTEYDKTLAQHLFVRIDAAFAEMNARKSGNDIPVSWNNVNMRKLAIDAVHRVQLGIDALIPGHLYPICLLYTSPSPRDRQKSRMPSSA